LAKWVTLQNRNRIVNELLNTDNRLAAKAAVLGHLNIGEGVQVGVASAVVSDQPAGARVTGVPAIEHRRWLRAVKELERLSELSKTVRNLEARIQELEESS
jgi:UDP-3-O-[3-hydroxymyristoyl] glucosamine N-acyltransferase